MSRPAAHRVVVVGGGFGGLRAVRGLRRAPVQVTLVDRQNYTLFQPLVYQVAAGRSRQPRSRCRCARSSAGSRTPASSSHDVTGFDLERRQIILDDQPNGEGPGRLGYDTLIVAGGSRYSVLRP